MTVEEDLLFRQGCSACFIEDDEEGEGMKGGGGIGDSVGENGKGERGTIQVRFLINLLFPST